MPSKPPNNCSNCGAPATHERPYRDVCPTDRGDEVREGSEPVCDECDPAEDTKQLPAGFEPFGQTWTPPTPPAARPLSAEQYRQQVSDKKRGECLHTTDADYESANAFAEAYAAHVSKPLVDALQDLYDGVNNEKFPPDARKRVWNELGKAEAALEQFRKGGRG